MTFITVIYVLLLLVFCIFTGFIIRHTKRYGHLAPRFKITASIFGVVALALILFSLYLMTQLYSNPSRPFSRPAPASGNGSINF